MKCEAMHKLNYYMMLNSLPQYCTCTCTNSDCTSLKPAGTCIYVVWMMVYACIYLEGPCNGILSPSLLSRAKLHHNAALVQVPIGLESSHEGVVDIINEKAIFFTGDLGWEIM